MNAFLKRLVGDCLAGRVRAVYRGETSPRFVRSAEGQPDEDLTYKVKELLKQGVLAVEAPLGLVRGFKLGPGPQPKKKEKTPKEKMPVPVIPPEGFTVVDCLYAAQRGLCFHCDCPMSARAEGARSFGGPGWTREHVVPKSKGGAVSDGSGNVVLAHGYCNRARGVRPFSEGELSRARVVVEEAAELYARLRFWRPGR